MSGVEAGSATSGDVLSGWHALATRWWMTPAERVALLGLEANGPVHEVGTYWSERAEARARLLLELDPVLSRVFGDRERVRAWLRAANAGLGGVSPIEVMASSPEWARWIIRALRVVA